ncbi:hypothetical protein [Solitalea canadensis]|uniref:Uncharacterized protein n=1 Tax=Solitalea canadensis (strain ATCC 29591 / DSM 3403 / JCM 21819 / LMG 8368 / NBRC 15130 / NCIMB 12057 / USAM 9D) TaxID=929556 RepID=H8KPR9_SOLCM|nr:hypothetical protein [Solitalea canadensis]AFD05967.1 hypothetical protein Solca_0852 [Solitalea canadensis DSM 3403]
MKIELPEPLKEKFRIEGATTNRYFVPGVGQVNLNELTEYDAEQLVNANFAHLKRVEVKAVKVAGKSE